jgi:hypothetical protein
MKKSGILGFGITPGITCCSSCRVNCYAVKGCYARFSKTCITRWEKNLELTMESTFILDVVSELCGRKKRPAAVRIHTEGDFYNQEYLDKWIKIAQIVPQLRFYAYTKMHSLNFAKLPVNFKIIHSLGGNDELVNLNLPHARIFKDREELLAAGYIDCSDDDLLVADPCSVKIGLIAH